MENSQTERLLKIAETDPELAHKIADFMKESDKISTKSVTEVKIVKDEEDKLVITDEQKRWVIGYFMLFALAILLVISYAIVFLIGMNSNFIRHSNIPFFTFFSALVVTIICGNLCAYKTGIPVIKQYFFKHFKFQ